MGMPHGANTSTRHEPSRLALFRFWLSERPGIVVLVGACLALALVFAGLYTPAGPSELVVGKVQSVRLVASGKYSNGQLVYVRLGSQTVVVHGLPGGCGVGDAILVRRQPMLWGLRLTPVACGSAAPITVDRGRGGRRGGYAATTMGEMT